VAYWVLKALLSPVLFLLFRVRVEGRHHVPRKGPAVLAANHRSFCDSFFIPLVLGRRVTFLAKAEYFDNPTTAWFFRAVGQIPVRRQDGDAAQRALETAKEVLAAGHLLAVYPEGTRAVDQFVHKGRTGVARLSRECGVPVVPIGLEGTDEVQPVDQMYLRPFRSVTVRFGAPLSVPAAAGTDDPSADHDHTVYRAFTDDLMKQIAVLAHRQYVDEYVPKRRREPAPSPEDRAAGPEPPPLTP
jgi:1-acyl-sn-glycerol-3-phosphate acyltransferase